MDAHGIGIGATANVLGMLYWHKGRNAEAEGHLREALSIRKKRLGDRHSYVRVSLHEIARALHAQGRPEEAEPYYRDGLEIRRETLPREHPYIAQSLVGLCDALLDTDRIPEALQTAREAVQIRATAFAPDHHHVTAAGCLLGTCLIRADRPDEGRPLLEANLTALEASLGKDDPRVERARARDRRLQK